MLSPFLLICLSLILAQEKAQLQKEALFLTAIQQIFIGRSVRLLPYSLHHYHCIFSTATSNIQRRQRR